MDSKMIKSAAGTQIFSTALPSATTISVTGAAMNASVTGQQQAAFPRGRELRYRQPFHGKTEHSRGSPEEEDSDIEAMNNMTVATTEKPGQRGSFLSYLTKLAKRFLVNIG
ncbi:CAMK/CAMKL/MARK protein kinase [Aphelenchoides avenae]|nr:CAMK/CAMKL/MARK protein kinase [Aphelenchus avenae]